MQFAGSHAGHEEILALARGERLRLHPARLPRMHEGPWQPCFDFWTGEAQPRETSDLVHDKDGWHQISVAAKTREGPFSSLTEVIVASNRRGENRAWCIWWRGHPAQAAWMRHPRVSGQVRDLVAQFETVGHQADIKDLTEAESMRSDGSWQCAGGAVFAAWLADQMGLERELQVGLYWHPSWKSLARRVGQSVAECHDERGKWDEAHGRRPLDEHHHWVRLRDPESGHWWLLDPNAEVRGEARLQSEHARYEADPAEERWSGIGPGTDVQAYMHKHEAVADLWRELQPALPIEL
jgi:hypothetical protein